MNTDPKKLLMRAKLSPFPKKTIHEILSRNLIGDNLGNLLFPYSISRTLMAENTKIDTTSIKVNLSEERIKKINDTYSAFILPFANAFRISFINELKLTTALVKQLTIPCIVIGIGAQAPLGKKLANAELEAVVKDFVKAVLEKSAMIGVRGEYTAEYLKGLGFIPEKDFTVIGCPSLYLYGKELPELTPKGLTPESSVSMNSKMQLPQKFHDFMYRSMKSFSHPYYIPQVIQEMRKMYYQAPIPEGFVKKEPEHFLLTSRKTNPEFPTPISFVDATSWLSFLKRRDFSFGNRIHGNIAALLAGTPAFIIASDERVLELVNYHHIPHMLIKELNDTTNIFDLYEKADFSQIEKYHVRNYNHYLDFLHKNNLTTASETSESKRLPFDRKRKRHVPLPALTPYEDAYPWERYRRSKEYHAPKGMLARVLER